MNYTNLSLALSLTTSLSLGLLGCDRTGPATPPDTASPSTSTSTPASQPSPNQSAPTSPPQQPDDPSVASFLGIEAPKPTAWQWQPPRNAMITANYTVPAPSGIEGARAVQLNVYYFGEGMGGSVEDNIERWKNQFRSAEGYEVTPEINEFEVDGMPVTFVELEGEWMQMGAVSFTRDQLFLAAIVDAPAGRIFIRFAGDSKTVEANREAFMDMIHGMRIVKSDVDDPGAPYDQGR